MEYNKGIRSTEKLSPTLFISVKETDVKSVWKNYGDSKLLPEQKTPNLSKWDTDAFEPGIVRPSSLFPVRATQISTGSIDDQLTPPN